MKTIIGILICLSLVSCERLNAPNENQLRIPIQLTQDAHPISDSTFKVENFTRINVGSVIIHLTDSTNANINVTDSGYFSIHIAASPLRCVIHGFSLVYSTPTWIVIDCHTSVHATWADDVVVIDTSEQN